ncbi:hypothetical protein OROGR_005955 [Orobanche gracilis]
MESWSFYNLLYRTNYLRKSIRFAQMADEVAYGAAGSESNKRKYEDSSYPMVHRATGFSSAPDSAAPPSSYNNVPPPMNEIELAKQKAQEIAARLLNTADPSKRARVENGAGAGYAGGFDAFDTGSCSDLIDIEATGYDETVVFYLDVGSGPKHLGFGLGGPPQSASYGYPGSSKKVEIPNVRVGVIIGKGGETIKYLQMQSGAKIQVTRDMDADPNSSTRAVELMGTPDQISKAEELINDVLSEAATGGSGIASRRLTGQTSGAEQFVMKVPNNKVGLVIGKGGETIKNMQARTGARIQVIPLHLPPGDMSKERTVQIDGTSEQIEAAKQLVEEVTSEGLEDVGQFVTPTCTRFMEMDRMRNQSISGGYNSQQAYQTPPSTNWGQPGYGYVQPGAYPGPPQYNMHQQPNYPGYPPTTVGYSTGWDQSTAPQNPQGGNYDYYSQQQPPQQQTQGGPTDGSGYNNGQGQAYSQGQGYSQDGYPGYQAGYSQPQTNPSAGYDHQPQQGYNAAYGNISNPTPPEGHTPSYGTQADTTNQAPAQPSPDPKYPHQSSTQSGYGVPPSGYGTQPPSGYGSYGTPQQGQKPSGQPAYAQPQQSPQGSGYGQPGYPPSQPQPVQPGYSQTDSGAQRPPMSGYPATQPGYGPPPYGASPVGQPGYGHVQYQVPPQYNSGYGGGYSQQPPTAYSTDAAAPQSAQPAGAAKASPPS